MFQESPNLDWTDSINEAEEKAIAEANDAKARIAYSQDFKELYENLEKIGILEDSSGIEKNYIELVDLIEKVRGGQSDINTITRTLELRSIVEKLLKEQKVVY